MNSDIKVPGIVNTLASLRLDEGGSEYKSYALIVNESIVSALDGNCTVEDCEAMDGLQKRYVEL